MAGTELGEYLGREIVNQLRLRHSKGEYITGKIGGIPEPLEHVAMAVSMINTVDREVKVKMRWMVNRFSEGDITEMMLVVGPGDESRFVIVLRFTRPKGIPLEDAEKMEYVFWGKLGRDMLALVMKTAVDHAKPEVGNGK